MNRPYADFFKPFLDRVLGLILTIATGPIILLLAIAIRIDSKGSPIFQQKRVGKNLKPFTMYKLRSMQIQNREAGSYITALDDPRITKFGSLIRLSSLDELPQCWNLLLGHMSLVGPRPDVPDQKEQYPSDEAWILRHRMKPGITGLAQATHRSLSNNEQRLNLDLAYIDKCSFKLDLIVLWRTVATVFSRSGVN